MDDTEPVCGLALLQFDQSIKCLVPSQPQEYMQQLVNTPVDLPLDVHLLQNVVEGFHKYVGIDSCTLQCNRPWQIIIHYSNTMDESISLTDNDSWPTPQGSQLAALEILTKLMCLRVST